jgi:hypothetical protein
LAPAFSLSGPAQAIVADPGLKAPRLIEEAACRTVRSRVIRPNGTVTFRNVRKCTPVVAVRCKVVSTRVVGPRGKLVVKSVRRCA